MLIILNKKVTEYKVVCRVSAQLCEEKNAQKETWPLLWQWRHPRELGFSFLLILCRMNVDYSDSQEKYTYKHSLAILVQPQVRKKAASLGPPETINTTILLTGYTPI